MLTWPVTINQHTRTAAAEPAKCCNCVTSTDIMYGPIPYCLQCAVDYARDTAESNVVKPSEAVRLGRIVEARERPRLARERREAISRAMKERRAREAQGLPSADPDPKPRNYDCHMRAIVEKASGLGGQQYSRAAAVVLAAEQEPERFGDLVEMMDAGTVGAAFRELERRKTGKHRHPVHARTHYQKAEKVFGRVASMLEGIRISLEDVNARDLDPSVVSEWAKPMGESIRAITRFYKEMTQCPQQKQQSR